MPNRNRPNAFRLSRRFAMAALPLLVLSLLLTGCPKPLPEGSNLLRDRAPGYRHQ